MSRRDALKAQDQLSTTDQFTTMGTLVDGTVCNLHLDSGAVKSIMSKQYYHQHNSLHGLSKLSSKANVFQAGNVESVNILLIIPIIITIQGHMFEIYTMVSEIHDNVDLLPVSKTLLNWREK